MVDTIKLVEFSGSIGIILPQELLDKLGVGEGDVLRVAETPNGIELTPDNSAFAKQFADAEQVMRADRDVLKKLSE
jgi:putative addiction module antidote